MPEPLLLALDVMVIQLFVVLTVHGQPGKAVTVTKFVSTPAP